MIRFLLLVLTISLCADPKDPYALAVTEGDPSSLIEGTVSAITGDLYLAEEDVVIQGCVPLRLPRFYVSGNGRGSRAGWFFLNHLEATYRAVNTTTHIITIKDPNSSTFSFEALANIVAERYEDHVHAKKKHVPNIRFSPPASTPGVTNTAQGEISARTNLKNTHIDVDPDGRHFTLACPDGAVRRYKAHHRQKNFDDVFLGDAMKSLDYYLQWERLPSGSKIFYGYDDEDRLKQIRTTNDAETKSYAWANFHYLNADPSKDAAFDVETSDGRRLCYRYERIKGDHHTTFLLKGVIKADAPPESIYYHEEKSHYGPLVGTRMVPGGRCMTYDYYRPGKNFVNNSTIKLSDHHDPRCLRVMTLGAPVGSDAAVLTTHKFFYDPGAGLTDILEFDNAYIRYKYTPQTQRLEYIHRHDANRVLLNFEAFSWSPEGNLLSRGFYDQASNPYFNRTFSYDANGNVTEEKLSGNLSGEASGTAATKKSYSQDGRNLLIRQEEPSGKVTLYTYLPNASLLSSKFICDGSKTLVRTFYEYNSDLVLIREITDDGTESRRRIKEITPMPSGPYVDMPYIIEEKTQERLLKKIVLSYTTGGLVDKKEVYDSDGVLRYILTTKYDGMGRPIEETNPIGQKAAYGYDESGNRIYTKDFSGRVEIRTAYDCSNRPTSVKQSGSDGLERTTLHHWNGKHYKSGTVDHFGNATYFSNGSYGWLYGTTLPPCHDANGNRIQPTLSFNYDNAGRQISSTNAKGETTTFSYNSRSQKTRIRHPDGTEEKFVYNTDGTLKTAIDQEGNKTSYTYDIFGRKTSETNALGKTASYVYDAFHLLSTTDAEGHTTTYAYDDAGRKIAEERSGERTEYFYDSLGRLSRIQNGDLITCTEYDILDRKIEERQEDAQGHLLSLETCAYDAAGNRIALTRTIQGQEQTERFAYDAFGRCISQTDPLGHETRVIYDEKHVNTLGQKVLRKTTIDPLGQQTIETYDAYGRLTSTEIRSPAGEPLSLEEMFYDALGNLSRQKSTIYPMGKTITTLWEYGLMNRLKSVTEAAGTPEQKVTRYVYNKKGLLSQTIKPDGVILERTYDAVGNLLILTSSDKTISYRYTYNALGDLLSSEDAATVTTRILDPHGRVLQENLANGLILKNVYDLRGRRLELTLPDASSIAYLRGALHLEEVVRKDSQGFTLYSHLYREHDLSGHVLCADLAGRLGSIAYTMNPLGRASGIQTSSFAQNVLAYDPVGNILQLQTKDDLASFQYDGLYQLTAENSRFAHDYSYDSHHNRLQKDSQSYQLNSLHQLSLLVYDANGNPILHGATRFRYDALDRLTSVETPELRTAYTYDSFHRRLSKTVSRLTDGAWNETGRLFFLYDGQNEIGACDSTGAIVELRILGKTPNAEIGAAVAFELYGKAYAVVPDLMGNVACLLSLEDGIPETYLYGAFGDKQIQTTTFSHNPWQFASKRLDEETGLIFYGRRYYDPELGRWLTPDPQGFEDGMNLYAFVGNNPLTTIDLYGLEGGVPDWVRDNWTGSLPGPAGQIMVNVPGVGPVNYTIPGIASSSPMIIPPHNIGPAGTRYQQKGQQPSQERMTQPPMTHKQRCARIAKNASIAALEGAGRSVYGTITGLGSLIGHAIPPLYIPAGWISGVSGGCYSVSDGFNSLDSLCDRYWSGWMDELLPEEQRESYYRYMMMGSRLTTDVLLPLGAMKWGMRGEKLAAGLVGQSMQEAKIAGKLTGYTRHGLNRAIGRDGGRGVHPKAILDAIKNPIRLLEQTEGRVKYIGESAEVVLNSEGKLISTFGKPRGPQVWNDSGVVQPWGP